MNTRWLKDFLILADCRKFTLAAQLSASSQAAFSRRIQQLEQHLKSELFDRTQSPIKLTTEGKRLYPIAMEMVQIADRCEEMVQVKQNPLMIASLHTLACNFFPRWYAEILQNTGAELTTSIDSGVRSVSGYQAALHSQRADCVLFYQSSLTPHYFDSDEYEVLKLANDALIWVHGRDLFPQALEQDSLPHLAYAPSSQLLELSKPLLDSTPQAKRLDMVFQSTISESLLPMAEQGIGIACIPHSVAKPAIQAGRLIHLWPEHQSHLEVVLIRLKHAKHIHPDLTLLFENAKQLSEQPN
ncbi:LysR family transcriptional regulator [Photobacterium sp. 1_MG-2023]|uniref:LysR family transcriptional regulator n=1 Tax=Photobacterium sp. 1_MG-2023 TaxID=3062646 RepID=UPI0026E2D034|nr:LysR family transcriptional regulator [Photobacterium sp. 1_MG-2023]MDO6706121.1 LysR family transcriptional regulator [Photobacterium sp. 1_MG-2023]